MQVLNSSKFGINQLIFLAETPEQYWAKQNVPADKEGRMMSYFFDVEAYQDQMREAQAKPHVKPKISKNMVKSFKKKKMERQARRILEDKPYR